MSIRMLEVTKINNQTDFIPINRLKMLKIIYKGFNPITGPPILLRTTIRTNLTT